MLNAIKILAQEQSIIWVQLSAKYFGWEKDIILGTTYIPPHDSKYYTDQYTNLEKDIARFSNLGDIKLMGDFNARLGNIRDYILNDSDKYVDLPPDYPSDQQLPRQTVDTKINNHGKNLASLCISTQIRILNGRTVGDTLGKYTYHDTRGCSSIDYFVSSETILDKVWVCKFMILHPYQDTAKLAVF